MFNWLYTKSKKFKKFALFTSGVGVGVSTATMLVSSVTSWIANLVGISGSGAYSVLKNMDIADSVAACQQDISSIVDKLSLKEYQEKSLAEVLRDVNVPVEEIQQLELEIRKELVRDSQRYANFNLVAQLVLGVTTLAINAVANLAAKEEKDNPLAIRNILNFSVVPLCMLVQYLLHITYVAKNLRLIATEAEDLRVKLSGIHESLLFRVRERSAFQQRRQEIENKIERLNGEITTIEERNVEIERQRVMDEHENNEFDRIYSSLKAQFDRLDISQYFLIENESQLKNALAKDFPNMQNVRGLIDYINIKRKYDKLIILMNVRRREFRENEMSLGRLIKEREGLEVQCQSLRAKEPEFEKIEIELDRLEEMKRSLST